MGRLATLNRLPVTLIAAVGSYNMLRNLLMLACLLVYPAYNLAAATIEVVVYADDSYPPYSYTENGELKGIYPAIFSRLFARMQGYKIQIRAVPWKRGLMLMETGQGLALFPPYARTDRSYMRYSNPVFIEQLALFCRNAVLTGGVRRTKWPEDFYGLHIGINAGFSVGGEQYQQAVKDGKIFQEQAPGNRSNLLKLMLGRIDCYINDRLSILWEADHIRTEGLSVDSSQSISEVMALKQEASYLAFTTRDTGQYPYKDDFIRQFNPLLDEMRNSGEMQHIVEDVLSK
jgi:polar amino acid transport system substrate-binding protein